MYGATGSGSIVAGTPIPVVEDLQAFELGGAIGPGLLQVDVTGLYTDVVFLNARIFLKMVFGDLQVRA